MKRIKISDSAKAFETLEVKKIGPMGEKHKQGDRPLNIDYAKKFLDYADIDYEAARVLFDVQDREYDFMNQAAFLCAQATEKYLKAFLFWNAPRHYPGLSGKQVLDEFKKLNHNLEKILDECIEDDRDLDNFREQINNINKFSLLKYPDIEDELVYSNEGLSISGRILKDIETLGNFIKQLINEEKC